MSLTSRSLLATMISLALDGPAMANELSAPSDKVKDEHTVAQADEPKVVRGVCIAPQDCQEDTNNLPVKITADSAEAINEKKSPIRVMSLLSKALAQLLRIRPH